MRFKLCTKSERNRVIRGRVINDLARFLRAILRSGAQPQICTKYQMLYLLFTLYHIM